ncbi:MAG: hypothetical protein ACXW1W_17515 [Methylococcaceae bacterium]
MSTRINHQEALKLAEMKQEESNLARCYLEMRQALAASQSLLCGRPDAKAQAEQHALNAQILGVDDEPFDSQASPPGKWEVYRRKLLLYVPEIVVTLLFGFAAIWIWTKAIGFVDTSIETPLLASLSIAYGPFSKTVVSFYMLACKGLAALIFGLFSSLPLALLLRRRHWLFWPLFMAVFIGNFVFRQMGSEDFEWEMVWLSFKVSRLWLFVSASALFFFLGYKLRNRVLPVSVPAESD